MNATHFSLLNQGGFVCRLHLLVRRPGDLPGEYHAEVEIADGNDIVLGHERSAHLGFHVYGIPQGSLVRPKAVVVAGKDVAFDQSFVYAEGAGTAKFVITGTTLNNHLGLMGLPKA